MPACAFAHHSTAANAAARRASRSALANAPCTSLLRRDGAAPLPLPLPCLLCPLPCPLSLRTGQDKTGQDKTRQDRTGQDRGQTVRAPGCEMRFAGVRSANPASCRQSAQRASHLGVTACAMAEQIGTLGLRGMRGMRLAINVFAASKLYSLRRNPH